MVKGDLVAATGFSVIEQAMWDLAGQALASPPTRSSAAQSVIR